SLKTRLALRARPQHQGPVIFQSWRELLFLHWEIPPADIQQTLPPGLFVDTFEGKAYLGLVPFFMRDIRPRFFPAVPGISNFLEVNVRTYVYDEHGIPGVWFYSLDANQWLAVLMARTFFKLPYFYARMAAKADPATNHIEYTVWRRGTDRKQASRFNYRGLGHTYQAEPGSLEFFLVERYILFAYSSRRNRLAVGQVHHQPYAICPADVSKWDHRLFGLGGLPTPQRPPDHLLFSPGVMVDVFALTAPTALV
ncbi:MAG: DUF2071 domain-containing protein, partial [Anaerolineae bacterium]|nr:DUF2071 domain-containing protein [Anaerolineae bacterium]